MKLARPDIKPAFAKRNIPIAISTDENYLPYAKVLVSSIAANTKSGNADVLILHSGITLKQRRPFLSCFKSVKNISVRFIDVRRFIESTELAKFRQQRYLSAAACYRLFLPDLLVAYDKVVYLDVDTVVCRDLGELYNVDVGDNLIGAVIDVVNSSGKREYAEWARSYGFVEWGQYVNTGVLLFNLAAFRKAALFGKLVPIAVEASKWFCDQDALNFVCKGRIVHLDPRWNVQVGDYCIMQQMAITKGEVFVCHFTGGKKPWNSPTHRFADLWWRHVLDDGVALWRKSMGLSKSGGVRRKICLSVIVPVFNAESYLWECLMSVLSQLELPNMEVVCIDDGSTDRSREILQTLQRLDSRIKLVEQRNQGPGVARNSGLTKARGEYIAFLDADDRLAAGSNLRKLLERVIADRLDMLVCGSNQIAADGTVLKKAYLNESIIPNERVFGPGVLGRDLYRLTPQNPWSKIYRLKFLKDNKLSFPALRRAEDFAFVQLAYALAARIGVETMQFVDHRIGVGTSCEATKDETPLLFLDGEKIFRDSMKRRGLWKKFKAAADISSIRRLSYNIGAVREFSSFSVIAQKSDGIYRSLKKSLSGVLPPDVEKAVGLVERVVSESRSTERLIDYFVALQTSGKVEKSEFDSVVARLQCQKARIDAQNAALNEAKEKLRARGEESAERFATIKRQRSEILTLREAVAKQKERGAAQDAALQEAWAKLKVRGEESAERFATIKKQRSEILNLRGAVAKQKERGDAQDAALKEAWAKLKMRGEESAERFATVKRQRTEILGLREAVAKLRERREESPTVKRQREEIKGLREAVAKLKERGTAQEAALGEAWAKLKARGEESAERFATVKRQRAEILGLREAVAKLRERREESPTVKRQREEIKGLREAVAKLKERGSARDAALKEAWAKLKTRSEGSAAAIKSLRAEIKDLRGVVAKQKERGDTQDAALKEAWAKLKARGEESAERFATIKQQRSEILNLRGAVAKQKERGDAQDAALKGAWAKLKVRGEESAQRFATIKKQRSEILNLRSIVAKQKERVAAQDKTLKEVSARLKLNDQTIKKQEALLRHHETQLQMLKDIVEAQG